MDPNPGSPDRTAATFIVRYQGLIAALIVGLSLRVSELGDWWLNPDEGTYYSILTRETFGGFWAEVASHAHPPLYYLLLRAWGLVSWDFSWIRASTVVTGLSAIAVVWAVAHHIAGRGARGQVAGFVAALALAFAPAVVSMSQVIRPYMLQVTLLGGALFFLLRYLDAARAKPFAEAPPGNQDLRAYIALVLLALLTHYSSALALGAFGLLVLDDGIRHGTGRAAWRRLVASHGIPAVLMLLAFFLHMRPLMDSTLADEALDGWLSPYMVDSPKGAWLAFMGFQHLLAVPWLRAATASLVLAAFVAAIWTASRRREGGLDEVGREDPARVAVLLGSGLFVALIVASLGAYPLGSTRHSAWLLIFTAPALGWIVAYALSRGGRAGVLWSAALVLLVTMGGPLGRVIGVDQAPHPAPERVLRQANLAQIVDLLDPGEEPELMVMSMQTYYLLLPFYTREREQVVRSEDGRMFHFRFGERVVLVSESWNFTAGFDPTVASHLTGTLSRATEAFPNLGIQNMAQAVLLVGGWRPTLVDQLASASEREPFIVSRRNVPGLFAYLLDVPPLFDAFGNAPAGPAR